jgi:hypothetical protein
LREQVQRNIDRFPDDFMLQLSESEVDFTVSQNAISSRKYLGGSLPYVFTEQGVASLAGVLKSAKAAEVHVKIMRAFVEEVKSWPLSTFLDRARVTLKGSMTRAALLLLGKPESSWHLSPHPA